MLNKSLNGILKTFVKTLAQLEAYVSQTTENIETVEYEIVGLQEEKASLLASKAHAINVRNKIAEIVA